MNIKKYLSCHHLGNSYRLWESSLKKKMTHPHLWCWHSITHLRQGAQGKLKWFHLKWCSVFLAAHRSRVWQGYRVTTFIPLWELVGQPYNPVYVQLSSLVFSEIWKSFGNYQNQRKKHWDLTYVWCFFVWHAVPNPDSAQQFNVFFSCSRYLCEEESNNHTASAGECHARIKCCFFILSGSYHDRIL